MFEAKIQKILETSKMFPIFFKKIPQTSSEKIYSLGVCGNDYVSIENSHTPYFSETYSSLSSSEDVSVDNLPQSASCL